MKKWSKFSIIRIAVCAALCLQLSSAHAQNNIISREANSNRVIAITTPFAAKLNVPKALAAKSLDRRELAKSFLREHARDLDITSNDISFSLIDDSNDQLGMNHAQLAQEYKGVPIFGAHVIVHQDKNSNIRFVNGVTLPSIKIDTIPKISAQIAILIAQREWDKTFPTFDTQVLSSNLNILDKGLIEHRSGSEPRLVWRIHLFHSDSGANEYYFVDAHQGQLIFQITGKNDLDREIGDCSNGDGVCYRGVSINGYVYGRTEGSPPTGPNPINGLRFDWPHSGLFNSGGSLDTDNIYNILGTIHNYYFSKFGLNGANNLGGIGDGGGSPSSVTWARTFINWDGSNSAACPNAFFSINRLNFCLGISTTDVVAHEYAHAVQNFSIKDGNGQPNGLFYFGESGALNEGHSDIFGEAVENYATGSGDWLIGEGTIFTRSLSDPTSSADGFGNLPDRFYSPNYYCQSGDNFGVHHNLGVFTKLAYLIAEGGTFNGCTIAGLGRDKEEQIIYRAVNHYFGPLTGFNEARLAINQACYDLYNADDCANVSKALLAVEMDQAGRCSSIAEHAPNCAALNDQCPSNPNKISPGVCGCDVTDTDSDGDGTPDCQDQCPNDPGKTIPGACGCGAPDSDTNSNGILDCDDIQVQFITPLAPVIKAKKRSLHFDLSPLSGVSYRIKVQILPRTKSGKKVTRTLKTRSISGTIKNLPSKQFVIVSYYYVLNGKPATLSVQSSRVKIKVK